MLVSTATRDTHRFGYPSRRPAEVLAVLVGDGSAGTVASIAVEEAVDRHAPVHFLQVVPSDLAEDARLVCEDALFREGLHALRGHPRTRSVFEVVRGSATGVIRSRSANAAVLVVGTASSKPARHSVAAQCLKAAQCAVRAVPV